MAEITSAIDFLKRVRAEDYVNIKFTKQDGTERIMKATLNFDKIPTSERPKKVDLAQILKLIDKNGILHVFDVDKVAWRSVPFNRVQWLQTPSKVKYFIKLKKGEE